MVQSFANEATADILPERNTKAARQIPKDLWRIVQRKLKMIDVAARVDDLESPPGNRLRRCVIGRCIITHSRRLRAAADGRGKARD